MALAGHAAAQFPHPWHFAGSISALPLSLTNGASNTHSLKHVRHEAHLSSSITETTPPTSRVSFESIEAALPAAARAWVMFSSVFLGEWASPHTKTPSLAKSTGRNLT